MGCHQCVILCSGRITDSIHFMRFCMRLGRFDCLYYIFSRKIQGVIPRIKVISSQAVYFHTILSEATLRRVGFGEAGACYATLYANNLSSIHTHTHTRTHTQPHTRTLHKKYATILTLDIMYFFNKDVLDECSTQEETFDKCQHNQDNIIHSFNIISIRYPDL